MSTQTSFKHTKLVNQIRKLARDVHKLDPTMPTVMGEWINILADMSKHEMRKWLRMKPGELSRLSNQEIYNLLAKLLPELERAQQHFDELNSILTMVGDTALDKRFKKYQNNILQFNDVLVAAITSPAIRYKEVIEVLVKRYPGIRKEVDTLVRKKTKLTTRLLKTTTEKLESGNKSRFPKATPAKMDLKKKAEFEEHLRVAGVMSYFYSLYHRSSSALKQAWEAVKKELLDTFDSVTKTTDSLNSEIEETTKELQALV